MNDGVDGRRACAPSALIPNEGDVDRDPQLLNRVIHSAGVQPSENRQTRHAIAIGAQELGDAGNVLRTPPSKGGAGLGQQRLHACPHEPTALRPMTDCSTVKDTPGHEALTVAHEGATAGDLSALEPDRREQVGDHLRARLSSTESEVGLLTGLGAEPTVSFRPAGPGTSSHFG